MLIILNISLHYCIERQPSLFPFPLETDDLTHREARPLSTKQKMVGCNKHLCGTPILRDLEDPNTKGGRIEIKFKPLEMLRVKAILKEQNLRYLDLSLRS